MKSWLDRAWLIERADGDIDLIGLMVDVNRQRRAAIPTECPLTE
ncbi:MAG TPA: hypothetical protein VGD45_07610 [Steroidobacter sp.]